MNVLMELVENKVLIFSGLSWIIAQIIKIIIALVTEKRFRPDRIFGDGGMPSGHSATVTSLAVLVGWTTGYNSVYFAIAMILAIIVPTLGNISFGGTSLLIVVGVALETVREIESQLMLRNYSGFLD